MRNYMIDELNPADTQKIEDRFKELGLDGVVDGIYWLPLPDDILEPEQLRHKDDCGPHCLALECGDNYISLELLVRAKKTMRCSCIAYATSAQREHMMTFLDTFLKELEISV